MRVYKLFVPGNEKLELKEKKKKLKIKILYKGQGTSSSHTEPTHFPKAIEIIRIIPYLTIEIFQDNI